MEKEVSSDRHGVDGAYVYTKIVRIKPRLAKTKKMQCCHFHRTFDYVINEVLLQKNKRRARVCTCIDNKNVYY